MALSGLTGIIGTIVFTILRRRIGLERTGLVAFNLEILCITLCVLSVWMPGSPFEPLYKLPPPGLHHYNNGIEAQRNCSSVRGLKNEYENNSHNPINVTVGGNVGQKGYNISGGQGRNLFKRHAIADYHIGDVINGEFLLFPLIENGFPVVDINSLAATDYSVTKRSVSANSLNDSSTEPSNSVDLGCMEVDQEINVSVILLILGIITSRVGKSPHYSV